jgi:hypothetical protein
MTTLATQEVGKAMELRLVEGMIMKRDLSTTMKAGPVII